MRNFFLLISFIVLACNGLYAQSLGKMSLGCNRRDIPLTLPNGYNRCTTNTNSELTYTTADGNSNVSFHLSDNVVCKIVMHKFVDDYGEIDRIKSKVEELFIELYDMWGEPSYIGENVYWQFEGAKATFTYTIATYQMQVPVNPSDLFSATYLKTFYRCYADIKLEKKSSSFE